MISSDVQRAITKSREPKLQSLIENFSWLFLGMIEVREVELPDGSVILRVARGQGRALKMKEDAPDTQVLVLVVPYGDGEEGDEMENAASEAEESSIVKAVVTADQKWKYAIGKNDERITWAMNHLRSQGLTVDLDHNRSATNIRAVVQLRNILYGRNDKRSFATAKNLFVNTIYVITSSYSDKLMCEERFAAEIIEAVSTFLLEYSGKLDIDYLVQKIRAKAPTPFLLMSMAPRTGRVKHIKKQLFTLYNLGKKKNKLPEKA